MPLVCVDTDPLANTFADHGAFKVRKMSLVYDGGELELGGFEVMIDALVTEDSHFVVDNGVASAVPLVHYLLDEGALNVIEGAGKEVVVHTVITGGQALLSTLRGLDVLCRHLPMRVDIVVWLNEFFGAIKSGGKEFEEMAVYLRHRQRMRNIVRIPAQTSSMFATDVAMMLQKNLTFTEAIRSAEFHLMSKQRLTMVKRAIFEQLATLI